MKISRKNYLNTSVSGRSLLEMLGVIAIMGVLTVGGLKGFQYALNRHAANQHLNDVISAYTKVMYMRKLPNKSGIKRLPFKTTTGKQMQYYGAPGYAYVVMPSVEADVCKQLLEMKPSNLKGIVDTDDTAITAETCESSPDLYFKFALQTIVTPQADEETGGSEDTDGTTTDKCATPPSCGLNECCRYLNTKDSCGNYQVQTGSTETRYYLNDVGCIESRSVCEFDRFYADETTNQSSLTETCDGICQNKQCVPCPAVEPCGSNVCCEEHEDICGNLTATFGEVTNITYSVQNSNGCCVETTVQSCSLNPITPQSCSDDCAGTCQNGICCTGVVCNGLCCETGEICKDSICTVVENAQCNDNSDCGGAGSGYFCQFSCAKLPDAVNNATGTCSPLSTYGSVAQNVGGTDFMWTTSALLGNNDFSGNLDYWNAQSWCTAHKGYRMVTANDFNDTTIIDKLAAAYTANSGTGEIGYVWLSDGTSKQIAGPSSYLPMSYMCKGASLLMGTAARPLCRK